MISVKKKFDHIPDILTSDSIERDLNAILKKPDDKASNAFKALHHSSVKRELRDIYHGKCAYCESRLQGQQIVDHYRPIVRYPWLIYEWSNLLTSCPVCNANKSDRFDVKGKRVDGPQADRNEWKSDSNSFHGEEPLLLNPEIDNPEEHLYFNSQGEVLGRSERGDYTISVCNLNREDLVNRRKEKIHVLINEFQQLLYSYIQTKFDGKALSLLLDNIFTKLFDGGESKAEFALFGRYIIEKFGDVVVNRIKDKKAKDILSSYYKLKVKEAPPAELKGKTKYFSKEVNAGYIERVRIKNYFCIKEIQLDSLKDKKEIYILGENGDGKTLLLQAIFLSMKLKSVQERTDKGETGEVLQMIDDIPDLFLESFDWEGRRYGSDDPNFLNSVYAYGVNRGRSSRNTVIKTETYGFMTLFTDDQILDDPVNWLMSLHHKELDGKTNQISLETAKKILIDILDKNVDIEVSSEGVTFIERGTPVNFNGLSEGYKSVLTWVCDLIIKLSKDQPNVAAIEDFVGVALVDEIELHLHPKWEYSIVKKLRNNWFKNIQFFFTTHSHNVIRGASKDAVIYKIYKEKDEYGDEKVAKLSEPYTITEFSNYMSNSIVTSPLFDMPHARMEILDSDEEKLDTSEDFWYTRIHEEIAANVRKMKNEGKVHFSKQLITNMVQESLERHRK